MMRVVVLMAPAPLAVVKTWPISGDIVLQSAVEVAIDLRDIPCEEE